jgi:PIN domain
LKKIVFIDTSEFVAANFSYTGSRFSTLIFRVNAGQIEIVLPTITKQEIISQIDKLVHEAEQAIAKTRNGARILRNLNDEFSKNLFYDFNKAAFKEQLVAQLEGFLITAKVVNLGFEGINPASIFNMYFSKQAPFGVGKKKSEFPDAFSLSILSEWGEQNQEDILIASSDSDIKEGADNFSKLCYTGTLEQLLNQVAIELDKLAPEAEKRILLLENAIKESIKNQFHQLDFLLDDQDGDVDEIWILNASYEANLLDVHDINADEGVATFDLVGNVDYGARLIYDDFNTAIYDSEEKNYIILNTIDETVDREEIFQATLKITFSVSDSRLSTFDLLWKSPKDVAVSSSNNDDWQY